MQAQWTPQLVQQRLREAFAVEQRLPDGTRPRGLVSAWPAAPVHSFPEMLHWTDARERVWQSWARAKGVYPYEVSRMEEAKILASNCTGLDGRLICREPTFRIARCAAGFLARTAFLRGRGAIFATSWAAG